MDDLVESSPGATTETIADIAGLYLGNILYAIELAAISLEEQERPDARKLAEARGRERQ